MSAVGVSIARAARVSRAYSSVAAAQSQTVACFGPLYTKPTKRSVWTATYAPSFLFYSGSDREADVDRVILFHFLPPRVLV